MEKHIIAGFAGIGKTVLGQKDSENVIDMEIRLYKYANYKSEYTLEQWYSMEHISNDDFLPRYFEAIKDEIRNGTHKIIFIWLKTEVLEWLIKENVPFTVATWNEKEDGIDEFLDKLYTRRGNPDYWRKKVIDFLYVINNYAKENELEIIKLNKNENIEMKLKEMKWLD